MKIVDAGYEILDPLNGEEILKKIERVARVCYKSEDKITEGSAEKMVRALIKSNHMAMLEHYSFSVKFICDRGVSHEIVRHRVASYAQESTRYCNYNKSGDVAFIRPVFFAEDTPEIPFDEFTNTEWRKIPKELRDKAYTIQPDVVWRLKPEERALLQTSFIDNPRDIERLYKAGLLVSKEKISTAHIEVELNRSNEYRIVKIQHGWTYDYGKDKRTGVILEACKLYEAYSKAKEEKERIEAKYKAERALSDYEWSVREIDKVLRLLHDDTLAKEYRRILLSMANVDDIEIKKIGNIIYYRYFSKKEPYKMVQL